jgi:hypothetical protein
MFSTVRVWCSRLRVNPHKFVGHNFFPNTSFCIFQVFFKKLWICFSKINISFLNTQKIVSILLRHIDTVKLLTYLNLTYPNLTCSFNNSSSKYLKSSMDYKGRATCLFKTGCRFASVGLQIWIFKQSRRKSFTPAFTSASFLSSRASNDFDLENKILQKYVF